MTQDMSPEAVTRRLRWVSEKRRSSYYSAEKVTRRLRKVEALRRLCRKLGRSRTGSTGAYPPS